MATVYVYDTAKAVWSPPHGELTPVECGRLRVQLGLHHMWKLSPKLLEGLERLVGPHHMWKLSQNAGPFRKYNELKHGRETRLRATDWQIRRSNR